MSDTKVDPTRGVGRVAADDPEFARSPRPKGPRDSRTRILDSTGVAILFGIVGPIVCFALKPAVSRDVDDLPGLRFIDFFWVFGYGFLGLEMGTLALWLWRGDRLGAWSGLVAGALAAGALFAGGLGLILLPFSLIGLMVVIGILGFMPFLTAVVFARAARRAFARAESSWLGTRSWTAVLLGMALVVGAPGAMQTTASLTVRRAIRDVAAGDASAAGRVGFWHPFGDCDRLVWAYQAEGNPGRQARLAAAYERVTGRKIEERLYRLSD